MKGEWCPYEPCLFCQEEAGCENCEIYLRRSEKMSEKPEFDCAELPPWLLPEGSSIITESPEELIEVFDFMGWPLAG